MDITLIFPFLLTYVTDQSMLIYPDVWGFFVLEASPVDLTDLIFCNIISTCFWDEYVDSICDQANKIGKSPKYLGVRQY